MLRQKQSKSSVMNELDRYIDATAKPHMRNLYRFQTLQQSFIRSNDNPAIPDFFISPQQLQSEQIVVTQDAGHYSSIYSQF